MKKKIWAICACAIIALVGLAGCGNSDATTGNTNTLLGQVTAIDGNNITLALGTEKEKPTQNDTTSGTSDTNSTTTGTDTQQKTPPTKPSSDTQSSTHSSNAPTSDGTAPTGGDTPPSGSGKGGPGTQNIMLTGENKTITITDSTVITLESKGQSSTGSVSDIAVSDVLSVTLSGNTVTAITVQQNDDETPPSNSTNASTDNSATKTSTE